MSTCTHSREKAPHSLHTEHYYQCKAPDEEGRDLSCECSEPIQGEDRVNCSCFISQQEEEEEPVYLDCLDALQKGETESKVYTIKPNYLDAFKVSTVPLTLKSCMIILLGIL